MAELSRMSLPAGLSSLQQQSKRRQSVPNKVSFGVENQKENRVNSQASALTNEAQHPQKALANQRFDVFQTVIPGPSAPFAPPKTSFSAKKKQPSKKSRVSFSTELEDVRYFQKGGRVSDVTGRVEEKKAPSRLEMLAKEFAKGEAANLKRALEEPIETPEASLEPEQKKARFEGEGNLAEEASPAAVDAAPSLSVASLLDELIPAAPVASHPEERSPVPDRRQSFTLSTQAPSWASPNASGANLSSAFEEIMAQQTEPVRASTTQQYTMAYEQLMAQYGTAPTNEGEEQKEKEKEDEMDMTSDLSGVVNNIMAPYKQSDAQTTSMELTKVFDSIAPVSPAPMDFTKTFTPPRASPVEADLSIGMDFTKSWAPQMQSAPAASPMPMEMTATFDALEDARTLEMEFTRALTPFKAAPPTRDDSVAMEFTRTLQVPEQIAEADEQPEDSDAENAASAEPEPEMQPETEGMDFTEVVSAKSIETAAREDATTAMELTKTLPAQRDVFDFNFATLLADSTGSAQPETPRRYEAERDPTENFESSLVDFLVEGSRGVEMEIAFQPEAEPVPESILAPAPVLAPASLAQSATRQPVLSQLLSECDLWRAYSAAPKPSQHNASISLNLAALMDGAKTAHAVAATKEDLLRVRYSVAAEVSALEQRASELRAQIAALEAEQKETERALTQQPSALQQQWPTLDDGQRLAAAHRLRRLWTAAKRHVQLERAEERHSSELARRQRLATALSLVRTSTAQCERQRAQLASLEEAMRFDLAQLRQRQRQRQGQSQTQPELAAPLALSPVQAHAREQDMFDILTGAVGWAPTRLAPAELAVRVGGDGEASSASLSLQLGLNVHQRGPNVPLVQHMHCETRNETLWNAQLEQQTASLMAHLQSPAQLVAALGALATRVGRVQRLQREVALLKGRHAKVDFSAGEGDSAHVRVLMSSLPMRRRFWLHVSLDSAYPLCAASWRIEASVGGAAVERQASAIVQETLSSLRSDPTKRFAWLTQLCRTVELWCHGKL